MPVMEPIDPKVIYDHKKALHTLYEYRKPRNHKKCWGRGYIGTRIIKGNLNYYLCDCVLKLLTPKDSMARITKMIEDAKKATEAGDKA